MNENVNFEIKDGVLVRAHIPPDVTEVTIPDRVTSIGFGAFEYCTSLQSVTIPDSVTSIDSYAFRNCGSLTSVTIPNSVTKIGEGAFAICTSLSAVKLPVKVHICPNAFMGTLWNNYYIKVSQEQFNVLEKADFILEHGQNDCGDIIVKINRTEKDKVENLLNTVIKNTHL